MASADFGDWGKTEESVRRDLERSCADPLCGHIKWAHGVMWWAATNVASVTWKDGGCTARPCRCTQFRITPPITEDEVIDLAEALKPDRVTLKDLGIESSDLSCRVMVTRWIAEGEVSRKCIKDQGHRGDHTW